MAEYGHRHIKLLNPNFTPTTTAVSASSLSVTPAPSTLTIIIPPTSSSSPAPIPATGLSEVTKMGIGVGVGASILAMIVSYFAFLRRRRHSYQATATQPPDSYQPPHLNQLQEPKNTIGLMPIHHVPELPNRQSRYGFTGSHYSTRGRSELSTSDGPT